MSVCVDNLTILVVEDEAIIRLQIATLLESWGHNVLVAEDAAEAMALIDAGHRPDVALLDIELGAGQDGVSISTRLREKWGIPSIFASGNLQNEILMRAIRTGPLNLLRKPFTETHLRRALELAKEALVEAPFEADPSIASDIWSRPH